MSVFEKGLITVLACDLLFVVVAIPLALRKVPRNPAYGYRTRATLADDTVWYEANAHFGRGLLVASLATGLFAVLFRPLFTNVSPQHFLTLSVVALVLPVVVSVLRTAHFVRSLAGGAGG